MSHNETGIVNRLAAKTKPTTRDVAVRIIENLEEMALPKRPHAERLEMIGEVQRTLEDMMTEAGYVRLVKPNE